MCRPCSLTIHLLVMIGLKGTLNVIDNSGALIAECINVLKVKTKQKSSGFATVGMSHLMSRAYTCR